jgi:hypothetical protein
MNMSTPTHNPNGLTLLPAKVRLILYIVYLLAGLVVGTLSAVYGVIASDAPVWLRAAQAAVAFLAVPFGALAAVNVPARSRVNGL